MVELGLPTRHIQGYWLLFSLALRSAVWVPGHGGDADVGLPLPGAREVGLKAVRPSCFSLRATKSKGQLKF